MLILAIHFFYADLKNMQSYKEIGLFSMLENKCACMGDSISLVKERVKN